MKGFSMMVKRTRTPLSKRYDFLYFFDVKDGNPNGDPEFANCPRFDPETLQGLVSDVCLKRKIRDYVFILSSQNGKVQRGYDIYVLQGQSLEQRQKMPYDNLAKLQNKAKGKDTNSDDVTIARDWMCKNFFDVRAFGAVMSTTKYRCGQVRGAAQITFARSLDRIMSMDHSIVRVTYTTEEKILKKAKDTGNIGSKHTVPYGLYCAHGFINPNLAAQTFFTEEDLEVLWQALENMFDLDRSASRGLIAARNLFVFEHSSMLGNASAHNLFELILNNIHLKEGKTIPRSYEDYEFPSLSKVRKSLKSISNKVTVTDKLNSGG